MHAMLFPTANCRSGKGNNKCRFCIGFFILQCAVQLHSGLQEACNWSKNFDRLQTEKNNVDNQKGNPSGLAAPHLKD